MEQLPAGMNHPLDILFPGGKTRALTLSYDDGTVHDRELIRILNRFGIKATFHLNSGRLGSEGYLRAGDIRSLYDGHEIASHTVTHPHLCEFDEPLIVSEVSRDMASLSELAGYPVRGFSYPYGEYSDFISGVLRALGVAYARTVRSTHGYALPENFLQWHPTCHHGEDLLDRTRTFLDRDVPQGALALLYVWGHSYEFHDRNDWNLMADFAREIGGDRSVWFCTNIELCDYLMAAGRLEHSADKTTIVNSGDIPVWIVRDRIPCELMPGQSTRVRPA